MPFRDKPLNYQARLLISTNVDGRHVLQQRYATKRKDIFLRSHVDIYQVEIDFTLSIVTIWFLPKFTHSFEFDCNDALNIGAAIPGAKYGYFITIFGMKQDPSYHVPALVLKESKDEPARPIKSDLLNTDELYNIKIAHTGEAEKAPRVLKPTFAMDIWYDVETDADLKLIGVSIICTQEDMITPLDVFEWYDFEFPGMDFVERDGFKYGIFPAAITNLSSTPILMWRIVDKNALTMFVFNPDNSVLNVHQVLVESILPHILRFAQQTAHARRDICTLRFIGHNAGKFDHFFLLPQLLAVLDRDISGVDIIYNHRIISVFIRGVTQWFEIVLSDSMSYLPAGAQSLKKAGAVVNSDAAKLDFSYKYMFAFVAWIESIAGSIATEKEWSKTFQSIHQDISNIFDGLTIMPYVTKSPNPNLIDNNGHVLNLPQEIAARVNETPVSLKHIPLLSALYCECDVKAMIEITRRLFTDIYMPNISIRGVVHIDDIWRYPTLSSVMYHNMLNAIPLQLYAPTGAVDELVRASIYGGRVCSSIVGEMGVGCMSRFRRMSAAKTAWRRQIAQWQRLVKTVDALPLTIELLQALPERLYRFITENLYVHLDICSQYPSALTEPLPVGPARFLEQEQINILHDCFGGENFKPCPFMAVVKCRAFICVALLESRMSNCVNHHPFIVPSMPFRESEASSLLWVPGSTQVDGQRAYIDGIWNTQDLWNMCHDGWRFRVVSEHGPLSSMCGVYWPEQSDYVGSFMRSAYELKLAGEQEKNAGKRLVGKISMNSSYGSTLFNVRKHVSCTVACSYAEMKEHVCQMPKGSVTPIQLTRDMDLYLIVEPATHVVNKRPSYIGSFCLSGSRVMLRQLRDLLDPNGKIVYVDTDSITCSVASIFPHLVYSTKITRGNKLGHFNADTNDYTFNIAYECVDGGDRCTWWPASMSFPCFLGHVIVLGRKTYAEQCFFCQKTRIRSKGIPRDQVTWDNFLRLVTWRNTLPYTELVEQHGQAIADILRNKVLPTCFKEDKDHAYFSDHQAVCKSCEAIVTSLATTKAPWTLFSLPRKEFIQKGASMTFEQSSISSHLYSKSGLFLLESISILRHLNIVPDTQGQVSWPCSKCNQYIQKLYSPAPPTC